MIEDWLMRHLCVTTAEYKEIGKDKKETNKKRRGTGRNGLRETDRNKIA